MWIKSNKQAKFVPINVMRSLQMLISIHIAIFVQGQFSSEKQVLGSRKMVAVFSIPNVNNAWNKAIGNWNCFHENVHHMSRNSSSYKIFFWPRLVYCCSLAVLSSLTFSVSVVTRIIYKSHSIAKFQMNSRRGDNSSLFDNLNLCA